MDCLTSPCICWCDSTREEITNKNNKQLVYSRGVIYNYCIQVDDWTVTLTPTLTINNEKGKCFDSNVCLNSILKWTVTCEAIMGVAVKTVKLFSWTVFSGAGDSLAQGMSSYVES